MLQIDLWVLGGQLVLLAGALGGAGVGYLRLALRTLRTTLSLGWVEQSLIAFYIPLGILYALASLPLSLFSLAAVLGVLAIGWSLLIGTELRRGLIASRARSLVQTLRPWGRSWIAAVVLSTSTLGLLAFEVVVMGGVAAPNTYDGSIQVDFVVLLLQNHAVPWTLAPFAPNAGVVYPQGTAVTLASATLLLGWPVVMGPAFLSPLFAALSVPAGYVLGVHLVGNRSKTAFRFGLILAVVLATISTWPRFLVGGSYDFLFSVPLLFTLTGEAIVLSRLPPALWRKILLYGVGAGILATLSLVSLQFILCFLVLLILTGPRRSPCSLGAALVRASAVAIVALVFISRSLMGWMVWWDFPGHTLTEIGTGSEWAPPSPTGNLLGSFTGLVDPFLFRPTDVWLSPFPILKAELAALLSVGLVLLFVTLPGLRSKAGQVIPPQLVRALATALGTGLLLISLFEAQQWVLGGTVGPALPSNTIELSIILFVEYTIVACFALLWAWKAAVATSTNQRLKSTNALRRGRRPHRQTAPASPPPITSLLASLILALPPASGIVVSVSEAPGYLGEIAEHLGNVTQADYATLEWMGSHLPECSGVLVAPGSAGEFLPAYSKVRLVFPMDPMPANLSYHRVLSDLTSGFVNATTLADLRALKVTEVLVTGRSNVLWKPFQAAPLQSSPDFNLVYQNGDARVFEFDASAMTLGCSPAP